MSHVDPTGEIWKPLVEAAKRLGRSQAAKGAAAGAGSGAGIEAGAQLIGNGGRLDCLDWNQIGQVALLGAAIGSAEAMAFEGLAALMNRVRVAMNARFGAAKAVGQGGRQAAGAIEIVASNGTRITGLTRHGVQRAIGNGAERAGTRPQAILDALKNPKKIVEGVDSQGRPFQIFTGADARVVINPQTGQIVSTNPLSQAGAL